MKRKEGKIKIKMKIKGLDKLQKDLKKLKSNAEELSRKKSLSFSELFPPKFMRKYYTNFSNIDVLLEDCGYRNLSQQELEACPDLDRKISERTKFKSWQKMMEKALDDYVSSHLFP